MDKKLTKTVTILSTIIISMFLLAFASVPIYNLFCKATGFGGTTQRASEYNGKTGNRIITVRFDANVSKDLPWSFKPLQNHIKILTGKTALAFYESENKADYPIKGMAVYNVTPDKAGIYFHKIECFCFEEQILPPHKPTIMPVTFYIDPALEKDPEMQNIDTITLSYSFFPVNKNDK